MKTECHIYLCYCRLI